MKSLIFLAFWGCLEITRRLINPERCKTTAAALISSSLRSLPQSPALQLLLLSCILKRPFQIPKKLLYSRKCIKYIENILKSKNYICLLSLLQSLLKNQRNTVNNWLELTHGAKRKKPNHSFLWNPIITTCFVCSLNIPDNLCSNFSFLSCKTNASNLVNKFTGIGGVFPPVRKKKKFGSFWDKRVSVISDHLILISSRWEMLFLLRLLVPLKSVGLWYSINDMLQCNNARDCPSGWPMDSRNPVILSLVTEHHLLKGQASVIYLST